MGAAVKAVLARRCGLREASRRWGVPYTTLRERVLRRVVARSVRNEGNAAAFVLGAMTGKLPQAIAKLNKRQESAAAAAVAAAQSKPVQLKSEPTPESTPRQPTRSDFTHAVLKMIEQPGSPFRKVEEVRNAWLSGQWPPQLRVPPLVYKLAPSFWGPYAQWRTGAGY